jgi:hypothetical protein
MLGQHPQLYGMPELNLFVAETMRERSGMFARRIFLNDGLLRAVAQIFTRHQSYQSILFARQWLAERRDSACVEVFRELASVIAPRRIVEKSPITCMRPEFLFRAHRALPAAQYLHLVRNPKAQANSVWANYLPNIKDNSVDYSTAPPTPDFQKAWFNIHANIINFLNGLPRWQKMWIRGEDLLSNPEVHLPRISVWLRLAADPKAIEAMQHPEKSPFACIGPSNAQFGNDPKFLLAPTLRLNTNRRQEPLDGAVPWRSDGKGLCREVRQLAREFGYR